MNTHQKLDTFLGTRDQKTVASIRATTVNRMGDGTIGVFYHGTLVVRAHQDGTFTLNSGGHHTRTTKARINEFSPAHVFQQKSVWYLSLPDNIGGKTPFKDGMRVDSYGLPFDTIGC